MKNNDEASFKDMVFVRGGAHLGHDSAGLTLGLGLEYKGIADVMDCSIGTVMSRLFYARKKLQSLLTKS